MALDATHGRLAPSLAAPRSLRAGELGVELATEARFDALWRRCHRGAGALPGPSIYAQLVRRYHEPHRRYHTLRHVDDCLRRFEWIRHLALNPDAIELALWFHDAVYEQCSADNERESAALYIQRAIGATPAFRRNVCSLILITRHLAAVHGLDRGFVVDIDLGGFALPWEEFRRQGRLVRAECAWQTEAEHAAALAGFLGRLIARPRFFATDYFHDRFEHAARANIARLLEEWRREGYVPPSA